MIYFKQLREENEDTVSVPKPIIEGVVYQKIQEVPSFWMICYIQAQALSTTSLKRTFPLIQVSYSTKDIYLYFMTTLKFKYIKMSSRTNPIKDTGEFKGSILIM